MREDDFYYRKIADNYRVYSDIWSDYQTFKTKYTWEGDDIFRDLYCSSNPIKACSEKLDEILLSVLVEFFDGPVKIIQCPACRNIIVIEGSDKRTHIEYNMETHELSGLLEMSLGDRNLTEITEDEIKIIQRALLVWIYENV